MTPISPANTQCPQIPMERFESIAKYSHCAPFQHPDLFYNSLQFMGYGDIFVCAQVCKSWNKFSENPVIFQQFFKNEGIPFVEQGPTSNLKEEFRVLYPRTISKKMGEKLFGNFPEELPCISREIFEKFYEEDPFEPGKLMMDTFKITVIPSIIERTSCEEFPYVLDQRGDLTKTDTPTEETLKIPNGIKNQKILCANSFFRKKNAPVFMSFHNDIQNQCNICPKIISLCFMREFIVGENMSYSDQEALLKDQGFEVTSLKDRVFFDAVCILTYGTCPDGEKPLRYARSSTAVVDRGHSYPSAVGGFTPATGADVTRFFGHQYPFLGVAPGVPAEVPR